MSGEDQISEAQRRLDSLREQYEDGDPHVIGAWTKLAELTGEQGDRRRAARLYQQLGDVLRKELGPFEGMTLDAYEGVARWVMEIGSPLRNV